MKRAASAFVTTATVVLATRSAHAQVASPAVSVTVSVPAPVVPALDVRPAIDAAADAFVRLPFHLGARGSLGGAFSQGSHALDLDGSLAEAAGTFGWVAAPWISVEAQVAYLSAAHRDATVFTGLDAGLGARLRSFRDAHGRRDGWSVWLGAGYLVPLTNPGVFPGGITVEAALARHVGWISRARNALDLAVELRARTGLGDAAGLQTLTLGASASWEGAQDPERDDARADFAATTTSARRFALGQTWSVEASGNVYTSDGTQARLARGGGGVTGAAGLVLGGPVELRAEAGWFTRGGEGRDDPGLNAVLAGGAVRGRWGFAFAEMDGGVFAPFGAFRDRATVTPFAGGALGVRLSTGNAIEDGLRVDLGVRTRFGIGGDHAFDQVTFGAAFEWESGAHSPAFPRCPPRAPRPVLPPTTSAITTGNNAGNNGAITVAVGTTVVPRVQGTVTTNPARLPVQTQILATEPARVDVSVPVAPRSVAHVSVPVPARPVLPMPPPRPFVWTAPVGVTLGLDVGYAVYLFSDGLLAPSGAVVSLRTGLSVAPWLEFTARGAFTGRSTTTPHDTVDMLLAEGGARFRYGWLAWGVTGGWAATVGSYAASIRPVPVVGAGVEARLGLDGPDRHFGLDLGLQARVGIDEQRTYDHLELTVGFEIELGHTQARPFPYVPLPPRIAPVVFEPSPPVPVYLAPPAPPPAYFAPPAPPPVYFDVQPPPPPAPVYVVPALPPVYVPPAPRVLPVYVPPARPRVRPGVEVRPFH